MQSKNIPIYLPCGIDASERWAVVAASLRLAGFTDIRPAPIDSMTYRPRHQRRPMISHSALVSVGA